MEERFSITDGPSDMDLAVSLFYFYGDRKARIPVRFVVQGDEVKEVCINMLTRESGSPGHWLFSGYVGEGQARVSGYFNTRTKSGWIEFDS